MINIAALVLKAFQTAGLNAYAEIPDPPLNPVMQVEENGMFAPSSQMPDHLYEADLELQTWASTKTLALALVNDVVEVCRSHPANEHGVVTRCQVVSNQYLRDPETPVNGQPGPRYLTILRLRAHH